MSTLLPVVPVLINAYGNRRLENYGCLFCKDLKCHQGDEAVYFSVYSYYSPPVSLGNEFAKPRLSNLRVIQLSKACNSCFHTIHMVRGNCSTRTSFFSSIFDSSRSLMRGNEPMLISVGGKAKRKRLYFCSALGFKCLGQC